MCRHCSNRSGTRRCRRRTVQWSCCTCWSLGTPCRPRPRRHTTSSTRSIAGRMSTRRSIPGRTSSARKIGAHPRSLGRRPCDRDRGRLGRPCLWWRPPRRSFRRCRTPSSSPRVPRYLRMRRWRQTARAPQRPRESARFERTRPPRYWPDSTLCGVPSRSSWPQTCHRASSTIGYAGGRLSSTILAASSSSAIAPSSPLSLDRTPTVPASASLPPTTRRYG